MRLMPETTNDKLFVFECHAERMEKWKIDVRIVRVVFRHSHVHFNKFTATENFADTGRKRHIFSCIFFPVVVVRLG